jgi:hypothetical protein
MKSAEPDSPGGDTIDVRCFYITAITSEIRVSEIIGDE